jgi:hypothetical protein
MIFVRTERPDLKRGMNLFLCEQNQTLVCEHEVGQVLFRLGAVSAGRPPASDKPAII